MAFGKLLMPITKMQFQIQSIQKEIVNFFLHIIYIFGYYGINTPSFLSRAYLQKSQNRNVKYLGI